MNELLESIPILIGGILAGIATIVGIYTWGFISSCIHEMIHIVVAYMLGFFPNRINIGHGTRTIYSKKVKNITLTIYQIPFGGMTTFQVVPKTGIRWKGACVSFAGLIAEVLLLLLSVFFLIIVVAINMTMGKYFMALSVAGVIVFISQFVNTIKSFFPRDEKYQGKLYPNDMKRLLQLITGKYARKFTFDIDVYEKIIVRYAPDHKHDKPWFLKADDVTLTHYVKASSDFKAQRYDTAIVNYQKVINSGLLSNEEKAWILDILASLPIVHGEKTYIQDAFAWIEEARNLAPFAKTLQGTYGSLLIEDGQFKKGIQVLKPLIHEEIDKTDMIINSCYLAKAYHALGDDEQATFWLQKGKSYGGSYAIYKRIEEELTSQIERTGETHAN